MKEQAQKHSDSDRPDRSHQSEDSEPGIPAASVSSEHYLDVAVERTFDRLPDIDAKAMALSIALTNIASAHVRKSEADVHAKRGRTWIGFRLLYMIWMFEPVEAKDLSRLADISRQTTSSGLRMLEKQGLISRERPLEGDRRLVSLRLTEEGRREAKSSVQAQNRTMEELFSVLDSSEQDTLLRLLRKVQRGQWSRDL